MSDPRDQLRREMARAYSGLTCQAFDAAPQEWRDAWFDDTEPLLPIVEQYAAEAAARALTDAANLLDYTPLSERESGRVSDYTRGLHAAATLLRDRAGRAQAGERQ